MYRIAGGRDRSAAVRGTRTPRRDGVLGPVRGRRSPGGSG